MATFDVVIKAVVIKTIRVEADTEEEAVPRAHMSFTVGNSDEEEDYSEDMISCTEVK